MPILRVLGGAYRLVTEAELVEFEEEIKELFLDAKIKAPLHLSRGSENQLIEVLKHVKKDESVFSTRAAGVFWQCLRRLSGVRWCQVTFV